MSSPKELEKKVFENLSKIITNECVRRSGNEDQVIDRMKILTIMFVLHDELESQKKELKKKATQNMPEYSEEDYMEGYKKYANKFMQTNSFGVLSENDLNSNKPQTVCGTAHLIAKKLEKIYKENRDLVLVDNLRKPKLVQLLMAIDYKLNPGNVVINAYRQKPIGELKRMLIERLADSNSEFTFSKEASFINNLDAVKQSNKALQNNSWKFVGALKNVFTSTPTHAVAGATVAGLTQGVMAGGLAGAAAPLVGGAAAGVGTGMFLGAARRRFLNPKRNMK